MNGSALFTTQTASWSRQCSRRRIASRITKTTQGTRNAKAKSARSSATMVAPSTGTAMRAKMCCSDHKAARNSHRAAADDGKRLEVDALQRIGRIARTGAGARRRDLGNALHVVRRQPYLERVEILVHALLTLGARDRHDVLALREQPREDE